MGTFSRFLFLSIFFTSSFNPILSSPSHETSSDLIQKTCKNTQYYHLCVSSLESDSSSLKADTTKGLALIMVRVGMANASATNSYLLISSKMPSVVNGSSMKKAMKECSDKYASANDALRNSFQDLSADLYDYAYMHVMAAADYPNACRNAFKRYPGLTYPPGIALREDGLKRICDVVLGIIDTIGW